MPVKRPTGEMEASKQRSAFFVFVTRAFFCLLGEMEASKQRMAAADSGSTPPADLVQQSSRYSFILTRNLQLSVSIRTLSASKLSVNLKTLSACWYLAYRLQQQWRAPAFL
jgi:hypothetical protein